MKSIMLLTLCALSITSTSWGADSSKATDKGAMAMNPSKEDREKMAVAHEKMATCLRSAQEFKECHEALHKECKAMMGGTCPGMEMEKGMGKGMKHSH